MRRGLVGPRPGCYRRATAGPFARACAREAFMTEQGLGTLFLFLHVGAAIIAFGPTFAFPIIGRLGGQDPRHINFALRVSETISDRLVLPFAISMPFTGVALIYFRHWNLADRSGWWLDLAIVLY